jgi:hypothetical protein
LPIPPFNNVTATARGSVMCGVESGPSHRVCPHSLLVSLGWLARLRCLVHPRHRVYLRRLTRLRHLAYRHYLVYLRFLIYLRCSAVCRRPLSSGRRCEPATRPVCEPALAVSAHPPVVPQVTRSVAHTASGSLLDLRQTLPSVTQFTKLASVTQVAHLPLAPEPPEVAILPIERLKTVFWKHARGRDVHVSHLRHLSQLRHTSQNWKLS